MAKLIEYGRILANYYLFVIKLLDQKLSQAQAMRKMEKYKQIGEDSYDFLLNQKRFLRSGNYQDYKKFMDDRALSLKVIAEKAKELQHKR